MLKFVWFSFPFSFPADVLFNQICLKNLLWKNSLFSVSSLSFLYLRRLSPFCFCVSFSMICFRFRSQALNLSPFLHRFVPHPIRQFSFVSFSLQHYWPIETLLCIDKPFFGFFGGGTSSTSDSISISELYRVFNVAR